MTNYTGSGDNVYPNDGEPFVLREPIEQKVAREAEKGQVLQVLPLLQDIIEHFELQIDHLESIDGIPREVRDDPVKFMNVVNANDLAVRFLTGQQEWLEGLIEDYAKQR